MRERILSSVFLWLPVTGCTSSANLVANNLRANESRLKELLLAGLAGEANAYRMFLDETTPHLRAFFRRRLRHWPDEVEDLVQESLLAMHNQRHTYDAKLPLTAWLYAIARYKLVDLVRRRAVREDLHESVDDLADILQGADTAALEAKRDIRILLDRLPDRQRLPIVHVKLEGLSVVETAALTGLSESAVKIGIHRGLKTLAAMIRGS